MYPKVERDAERGHVLWLDDGVSQPLMDHLTVDVDEYLLAPYEVGR